MDNHCAICGSYLADTGRMVCPECEKPKKEEIKSCPFCGRELLSIEGWKGCVWVECINCHTEGPDEETKEEAIEAWNRRAESEELKFTRKFIHEQGLDFALMSAWNRRKEDGN